MIHFVWPPNESMLAGMGGTETFTAGHVRELLQRGIDAQIVTTGLAEHDGRRDFPDLPFVALDNLKDISKLSGTVVFINHDYGIPTKTKAAVIFHTAITPTIIPAYRRAKIQDRTIIVNSNYNRQQWALYFKIPISRMRIVRPFADPYFGAVKRPGYKGKTRLLYAGRLHPDKGIYTFLEALHQLQLNREAIDITIVAAGLREEPGKTILGMLHGYPYARVIPARKTVKSMAKLLANSDVLVMPSVYAEPFGMLSVEAQHAGCRVVASNVGGLPETNCGLLSLVKPHAPSLLIKTVEEAIALGAVTSEERKAAANYFTLQDSVDNLLKALA